MDCIGYVIVNTLHTGDDGVSGDGDNNYNDDDDKFMKESSFLRS